MTQARLNPTLKAVSDAVLGVAANLSVDEVLQKLVDAARELAGARYAALGIPDGAGGFRRFLVAGMSDELIDVDGPLAADPRDARGDAPPGRALPDRRHPRGPALPRLVAAPAPGHALVPGRPDHLARREHHRRLLPDREGGRDRVRRRGPGADRAAGRSRLDRNHQRPPVRAEPRAVDPLRAQPPGPRAARCGQPEAVQRDAHRRGGGDPDGPRSGRRASPARAAARAGPARRSRSSAR